jgi:hypothetical protein
MPVYDPSVITADAEKDFLDVFERDLQVEYRDERYRVRDNGAVFRQNRFRKRARPLDKHWTFGRQNPSAGYMHLAGVPVHRIVCTAFHGSPPTDQHVVDHIDTNRANNRPENLRWVSSEVSCYLTTVTVIHLNLGECAIYNNLWISVLHLIADYLSDSAKSLQCAINRHLLTQSSTAALRTNRALGLVARTSAIATVG